MRRKGRGGHRRRVDASAWPAAGGWSIAWRGREGAERRRDGGRRARRVMEAAIWRWASPRPGPVLGPAAPIGQPGRIRLALRLPFEFRFAPMSLLMVMRKDVSLWMETVRLGGGRRRRGRFCAVAAEGST